MVNLTTETPIQLDGPGFRARLGRKYGPGEYYWLSNMEIYNGALRPRRSIKAMMSDANLTHQQDLTHSFLGHDLKGNVITTSNTQQLAALYGYDYSSWWAPTDLPKDALPNSWSKLVGVYVYNNKYHWIQWSWNETAVAYEVWVHTFTETASKFVSQAVYADLTHTKVLTIPLVEVKAPSIYFKNFFIQGERLWLLTSERLYFSKATDHTDFTVPLGGFFDFQGERFTWAGYNQNTIYVLTEDSLFSVTYNNDPNADASALEVSNNIGGFWGTIHKGVLFFVNKTAIYSVINNNIDKVKDIDFFDFNVNLLKYQIDISIKIVSYQNYLVLLFYYEKDFSNAVSLSYNRQRGKELTRYYREFNDYYNDVQLLDNVFFINTDSGSVHSIGFTDCYEVNDRGYITDMLVVPQVNDIPSLMFLTTKVVSANPRTTVSNIYRMNSSVDGELTDTPVKYGSGVMGTSTKILQRYKVEIDGWSPTGEENTLKKFRYLHFEGQIPEIDFIIQIAFNENDYSVTHYSIVDGLGPDVSYQSPNPGHPPYSYKLPINQKAKSISIRFILQTNLNYSLNYDFSFFLNALSVIWTPTARAKEFKAANLD